MMMLPPLSPTLKEKDATKWMTALRNVLGPYERVTALARISSFRPTIDGLAVTDRRVIAFFGASVASKGALIDVAVSEIERSEIRSRPTGHKLVIFDGVGSTRDIGTMKAADMDFVVLQINAVARAEPPRPPTVDVYDPFTQPWISSSSSGEAPEVFDPSLGSGMNTHAVGDELPAFKRVTPTDERSPENRKRLVPLRKSLPALVLSGFFGILTVVAVFDPEAGLSIVSFCALLTLLPLLALSRARRNAIRRLAETAGATPVYGVFDRNWLPIGIPLATLLFVGFIAGG